MPGQLEFPALDIPAGRPLVPIEAAMVLADKDEDAVLNLIECGRLPWAWDIRGHDADRREVRIWRDSLIEYLSLYRNTRHGQGRPECHPENAELTESEVLALVIPHSRDELRSTELQRMLSCSQCHVAKLLEDGLVNGLNPSGRGPNGFVRVTRISVIRFLQMRRLK